jgi:hypothetical protein
MNIGGDSFAEYGLCMLDMPSCKLLNKNRVSECAISFEFMNRSLQVFPIVYQPD